jgi:osmoprotectant transport system substrate-binding protein
MKRPFNFPTALAAGSLLLGALVTGCAPAAAPSATTPESLAATTPEVTLQATEAAAQPTTAPAAAGAPVKIGSKNFTESYIVAEMYAAALEHAGLSVERKLDLGATDIAQAALERGDIDLYPEYTSTALLTVLKGEPLKDPAAIYAAVKDGYAKQFNLAVLEPAPFNNPNALATSQEAATKHGLKTYSDLAAKAGELVLGAPPEFMEREDGLPGLQQTYGGFEFKEVKQLDPGLRYPALAKGDVDAVVAFGTDGQIAGLNLVLLEDDKQFYPPYQVAPVVRMAALEAHPQLTELLGRVNKLLTTADMQALNWKVDGPEKEEPAAVARTFLMDKGILR